MIFVIGDPMATSIAVLWFYFPLVPLEAGLELFADPRGEPRVRHRAL